MDKKDVRKSGAGNLEEIIALVLSNFGGVKHLTLVSRHIGDHDGNHHDHSQLLFIDPIDTDFLEVNWDGFFTPEHKDELYQIHYIPNLEHEWMHVDMVKLERLMTVCCISGKDGRMLSHITDMIRITQFRGA
jgi:hypothetical protein